jgi:uncharacterized protein YciI
MKYVLVYETDPDEVAAKAAAHFPAHQARWHEFRESASLLLVGPFTDRTGAMAVFTTRAAAEEFAGGDPFVVHGLVRNWYIREWLEAIATP